METNKNLDNFDRKILAILQQDAKTVSAVIASQVGLSQAAVQRRINRMRDDKIIESEVAVVEPKAIGQNITLVVAIELDRVRSDVLDAFKRQLRKLPQVQQCYYVTGETDLILVLTARDMDDYDAFTRKVFFGSPFVRRWVTNVVLDRVKVTLQLPIEESDEQEKKSK